MRQRHVPLRIHDRLELDRRKRDYEERTGDVGDWGEFLGVVTLAGMAALGIYSVAQMDRLASVIWQVRCSSCGVRFPVKAPSPAPWRLSRVTCVKCEAELVLDFVKASDNAGDTPSQKPVVLRCHYCEQEVDPNATAVNPHEVEYLKCPRCDRVIRLLL